MRVRSAAAGSALFFVVAPGVVVGVIPWWLSRWQIGPMPAAIRCIGALLLALGLPLLVSAFVRFVRDGLGTPAPVAPTERLVVSGAYRYVRNPMYLAVLASIAGQGLLLGQPALLAYGAAIGAAVFAFVRLYEEPVLRRRFGAEYEAYCGAVPGWWPRVRPWTGSGQNQRA